MKGYELLTTMDGGKLLKLLKVEVSCDKDRLSTWIEGTGVWVEIMNGRINFAGSNAYKIHWYSMPIEENVNFSTILDSRSVAQLKKFVHKKDKVDIYFKKENNEIVNVAFQTNRVEEPLIAFTINGTIPKYQDLSMEDKEDTYYAVMDKQDLQDKLQSMIKKGIYSEVHFVINEDISIENDTVVNKINTLNGKFIASEFKLNANYIIDFLKTIDTKTKEITLYYDNLHLSVGHTRPVQFLAKDGTITYRLITMPSK